MAIDGRVTARSPADRLRARQAALGQPSSSGIGANHWASVDRDTLSLHGERSAVADSGMNPVTLRRSL